MMAAGSTCPSPRAAPRAGVFGTCLAAGGGQWGSAGSVRSICTRRARQYRELVDQGIDPVDHRRSARGIAAAKTAMTFQKAALAFIDSKKSRWTAPYAQQWVVHFETYVFPEIGALPMQAVNDTD